jgi:hypothetical protein
LLLKGNFEAAAEHVPKRNERVNNALSDSTQKTALILNSLEDSEYISARVKHNKPWQLRLRSNSYFQDIEEEAMQQAFLTSVQRAENRRESTLSRTSEQSDFSDPTPRAAADANPTHSPQEKGSRPSSKQQDRLGDTEGSVLGDGMHKKPRKFDGEDRENDETKIKRELPPLIRDKYFMFYNFYTLRFLSERIHFCVGTLDTPLGRDSMTAISG